METYTPTMNQVHTTTPILLLGLIPKTYVNLIPIQLPPHTPQALWKTLLYIL